MTLGSIAIKLSLLFAAAAFFYSLRWARGAPGAERRFRWAYHGLTASLAAASAHLMFAILTHDFRYEYVLGYTSRDLPPLYLISAFWAGQSGTFLLWALLAALVGYALFRRGAWEPARAMSWYLPTVGFLQLLMLDPGGDPFRMLSPAPADGRGLNPLLQDPWMASHPPAIFLGYGAMAVPAALGLVALQTGREKDWLRPALRWSLVAFVALGAGIILGGFWAYKVLGWGGYWGWDPVENASLVPWLVVAALAHGLLVQRATGALPRTNLALALAGYLLVIYATFLTRSGVLADFSVHSFPEGTIYRLLVAVMLVTLGVSGFMLLRRRGLRGAGVPLEASWPFAMSAALVALVACAALVLVGTSWPMLSALGGKASALAAPFYNRVTLPIAIVLLALLGVAPFLAWTRRPWSTVRARLAATIALALAATLLAWALGARGTGALALFAAGVAALAANLLRLGEQRRAGLLHLAAPVAHAGFALMFLGIVGSSAWGVSQKAELPLGQPVEVLGRTLTFLGHVEGSEPQDRYRVAVRTAGGEERIGQVWIFRAMTGGEAQTFHRPAIVRRLGGDLYIAPAGLRSAAFGTLELARGTPVPYGDARLTFVGLGTAAGSAHGMTVHAHVQVERAGAAATIVLPLSVVDGRLRPEPVRPEILPGVTLALERMSVEQGWIRIDARDDSAGTMAVLSVEASTKPLVGLLWAGTLLLVFGCAVAIVRRSREEQLATAAEKTAARAAQPRAGLGRAAARAAR